MNEILSLLAAFRANVDYSRILARLAVRGFNQTQDLEAHFASHNFPWLHDSSISGAEAKSNQTKPQHNTKTSA